MNTDVALWFARNIKGDIKIINEVENNKDKYFCPLCNSEVIPKAIKDNAKVTSHFAHLDKSKCTSETMIHWWFKNKFLECGDNFIIKTDCEHRYICKEILIEQSYKTKYGDYKPDITIITENGETIYFEMNYTSKKKLEDYLNKWLELKNIVVEVNIKSLMQANYGQNIYVFKTLFYQGKCMNMKRSDKQYYNIVGDCKSNLNQNKNSDKLKLEIEKLDLVWNLIRQFKLMKISEDELFSQLVELDCILNSYVFDILYKSKCTDVLYKLLSKISDSTLKEIKEIIKLDDTIYSDAENHISLNIQYGNRYNKATIRIDTFNIEENCWYVSNLSFYKTKQEIMQSLIDSITTNQKYLIFKKEIKEERILLDNFEVEFNSNSQIQFLLEKYNNKEFKTEFILEQNTSKFNHIHYCQCRLVMYFNDSHYEVLRIENKIDLTISNDIIISNLVIKLQQYIEEYFIKLKRIDANTIIILNDTVKYLRNHFEKTPLKIKIHAELKRPDYFNINITYHYKEQFFSKHGNPYFSDYEYNKYSDYYISNSNIEYRDFEYKNYNKPYDIENLKHEIINDVSKYIRKLKSDKIIKDLRNKI